MLTDGAERVRCDAVDSILDLRAQNNKGDTGVRKFRIPKINQDATHVTELIKMGEEELGGPYEQFIQCWRLTTICKVLKLLFKLLRPASSI